MTEQPPADRILRFKATPGLRGWKRFFVKESVRHPAKMNLLLLRFLLETYTKEGETVVDPMAGIGSTIVLASLLGRNGVAVELEPKFCDMIRGNIEKTSKEAWFRPKGRMACIQGDSREFSKLLAESEAIISSPPYGNRLADVAIKDMDPQRMGYRQAISIVTSPPYEGSLSGDKDGPGATSINNPSGFKASSDPGYTLETTWTERNKPEAVVTSPPFGPSQKGGGIYKKGYVGVRRGKVYLDPGLPERQGHPLSDDPDNIDNMPYVNIGNMKGGDYLSAMQRVYEECFKVLKPGGIMVLVVRNFVRNFKLIRLDQDTIQICEAAGFKLKERWWFKLPTKSFWRINMEHRWKKEGREIPSDLSYEHVLVLEKPLAID